MEPAGSQQQQSPAPSHRQPPADPWEQLAARAAEEAEPSTVLTPEDDTAEVLDVNIVPLTAAHFEQAVRLHRDASFQGQPVFGRGEKFAGVQEMLECMAKQCSASLTGTDGDVLALVAVSGDDSSEPQPVYGVITAQVEQRQQGQQGPGQQLVLLTLVVSEDVRGCGIGSALVEELTESARAAGLQRIVTDVAALQGGGKARVVAANEPAVAFFTAEGFRQAQGGSSTEPEARGSAQKGFGARRRAPARPSSASIELVLDLTGPEHQTLDRADIGDGQAGRYEGRVMAVAPRSQDAHLQTRGRALGLARRAPLPRHACPHMHRISWIGRGAFVLR